MSKDLHWITTRITQARKGHASVTDAVSTRMDEFLNSQLIERQLSPTELTKVAKALIADMIPAPPKVDLKQ